MSTVDIGECRGDEGDFIAVYYQSDFRRHQHAETLHEAVAGLWWGSDQNLLAAEGVIGPDGSWIYDRETVYDAIMEYDERTRSKKVTE